MVHSQESRDVLGLPGAEAWRVLNVRVAGTILQKPPEGRDPPGNYACFGEPWRFGLTPGVNGAPGALQPADRE